MTDPSLSTSETTRTDVDRPSAPGGRVLQRLVWPGIIFYLLGGQVLLILVTVYLATRDNSFAVEPDYYQQALRWDDVQAQEAANQELGWTVVIDVGRDETVLGERLVRCTVRDRSRQPVEDAVADLVAFAHARGNDRHSVVLQPGRGGVYAAPLSIRRSGIWECRLVIRRGEDTFTHRQLVRIAP